MQATANDECDQTEVGGGQHVDDKDDKLLNTGDRHEEHGLEASDGLFHISGCELVDTFGHVVGH